jgi:para-aminobenzoate synthetase
MHGATLVKCPPIHGQTSLISHNSHALFKDLPEQFHVVRYHSLAIVPPLGDLLRAIAWTVDGDMIMGLEVFHLVNRQHVSKPMWGLQFHPESIETKSGRVIIGNFFGIVEDRWRGTLQLSS